MANPLLAVQPEDLHQGGLPSGQGLLHVRGPDHLQEEVALWHRKEKRPGYHCHRAITLNI